ncbi:transporter substrate-binding domain-containing protein [Mesorhizobium sp. B2-4-7]|nr:transporter substrate-binding domain-containing protein [Mesorhizobium sp. B2-5-2]TPL30894.1 transporter substrate-binding domain-containing protein [Mesorhizobium sp. B2-4-7]TPL36054.1 transporter substrate-binding domain-containing protein [Mesorhizobium sp. B2-4-5]TPM72084.1 transporter substrate-binding domain-containing protein [Mesorhizobium sp. B2-1-6]TPN74253.1 transporter substrate-binding domain-containing protein [Mesorhizobium sp. B1-1-2]
MPAAAWSAACSRQPTEDPVHHTREESIMLLKRLAVGVAAMLAMILPAKAESTLDAIVQRGTINVGVGLGTPPYGLMDSSMQPDGYDVSVTRASTNDIVMTKKAVEGAQIQRYDDDASTSQALFAGQVEGIVTSGALARAVEEHDPNLKKQFVVAQAPMGIGLRRNDPDFLHWLNTELFMLQSTGELQALQKKWMGVEVDLPRF